MNIPKVVEALITLAQDKDITGGCYRVLFILLGQLDFENYIYVPQKEIAEKLDMDPAQVSRSIKLLVQKGILLHSPCGYRLNANYDWKGKVRHLELTKSPWSGF
jgi:DNA-binding MarR family transcriptional regulator